MDVLGRLLAVDMAPDSDFWYGPVGEMTAAGVRLDAESAKKVSAWFRGRDILATTLAMLPFDIFQRLPNDGGPEKAPQYYLHDVIHRKPNPWQDSFTWRRVLMYWLIDHGNAYNRIVSGPRGFVSELRPIHPSLITPKLLTSGRKLFEYRNPETKLTETLTQDDVFHLMVHSDDGIVGKGILQYARDSLGLSVVMEQFAGKVFSKGSLSAGALEVPGTLTDEVSKRMAKSFATAAGEWHLPKVLEMGAKWVPGHGMTPENAQMLLSRKFGIDDVARWLGLPPHMLASLDRSTNNNIEHQGQEFIDYAEGPWLCMWEAATNDQLIARPHDFYAEFNRSALVRGDIAARWEAYMKAVQTGIFTRNEVRIMENKKKLDGLDEPLDPAHLTGKGAAAEGEDDPAKKPAPAREDEDQAQAIAVGAAERLLRKEVKAMQKFAVRHASDQDAFAAAVTEFYADHVALVQATLVMGRAEAERYCAGQAAQVIGPQGIRSVEAWESVHYARGLVALALEAA